MTTNIHNKSVPKPSLVGGSVQRPIAIFSDFDGTIFHQDTGHILFDNYGCGPELRQELDGSIGAARTFREASEEMWGSLNVTLEDGLVALKKHLEIDPGFMHFLDYINDHEIPFTVISAGLEPLLRGALDTFLGPERAEQIGIVSNDGEIAEDGSLWKPLWRHECELGHDKAQSIQEFRDSVEGEQPLLVFIGDGVSDLPAASRADILFARRGLKLEQYCIEHQIPYIPYDSFSDIEIELYGLVKGNKYHDFSTSTVPSVVTSEEGDLDEDEEEDYTSELTSPITPATPMVETGALEGKIVPLSQRPMQYRAQRKTSNGEEYDVIQTSIDFQK
ncbi:polyol phosphate phosphatase Pyp1p [Trichomonascus vanleenenianus]|uniref:polyol phosphate phosphatase Pyp1p n=1 Tax=Trichomonascus vanleenenianus TaxID=2268995 RepID=UPI003ECB1DE2